MSEREELQAQLDENERQLEETRRQAASLRGQAGSDARDVSEREDVAVDVERAEEQEAIAGVLEQRRDRLRQRLADLDG